MCIRDRGMDSIMANEEVRCNLHSLLLWLFGPVMPTDHRIVHGSSEHSSAISQQTGKSSRDLRRWNWFHIVRLDLRQHSAGPFWMVQRCGDSCAEWNGTFSDDDDDDDDNNSTQATDVWFLPCPKVSAYLTRINQCSLHNKVQPLTSVL